MDAHAWVEVYEEGFGWRYVEVTGFPAGDDPTEPGTGTGTGTAPGTGGDSTEPPVEPDKDPTTWGDLLAATNGQFALSPSIPPALLNSKVFTVTNDTDARLLLKLKSFGDYTGQGFATAPDCPVFI
jgi:transglutaminase-like putative cysteine protease